MTPQEQTELKNFAKNTQAVLTELETMLKKHPNIYKRIDDCNWRIGDVSILCDEVVELVDLEVKA